MLLCRVEINDNAHTVAKSCLWDHSSVVFVFATCVPTRETHGGITTSCVHHLLAVGLFASNYPVMLVKLMFADKIGTEYDWIVSSESTIAHNNVTKICLCFIAWEHAFLCYVEVHFLFLSCRQSITLAAANFFLSNMSNTFTTSMEHRSDITTNDFVTMRTNVLNTTMYDNSTASYRTAHSVEMIAFLQIYFAPILLLIGTSGNILSFVVFSQPVLKHSPTAFYFRVLAVADTLALNIGLWPGWVWDAFGVRIYPITDVSCRIQVYLGYTLPHYAVWVLVIMTIERMASVRWPHHGHIFTRRRLWISVFTTMLVLVVINIPVFWIATENYGDTSMHPCKAAHFVLAYQIWPWVDLSIYSFLPFVIMISCSTVIIKTVYQRRKTLLRRGCGNGYKESKVNTMTATLLTVTFVFLLLTAPFAIYAITLQELHGKVNVDYHLFYFFARSLRYVNHAVNFFLYCLSGKHFRRELIYLLRIRRYTFLRCASSTTDAAGVITRRYSIGTKERTTIGSPV